MSPTDQAIASIRPIRNVPGVPSPAAILYGAYYHGVKPDFPTVKKAYGERFARAAETAYIEHLARHENLGEPEDITHAIEGATVLTGIPGVLRGLGEVGVRAFAKEAGAAALKTGEEQVAAAGEKKGLGAALGRLTKGAEGGAVRRGVTKAAKAAEPAVVRDARELAARRAAAAVEKVPKPVKAAGRVGGRVASAPVKHPFTAPLALQAPIAAFHGNPNELLQALEGKGAFADISAAAASKVGSALPGELGHVAQEAITLPSVVLPSTFLTSKAAISAARGDDTEAKALLEEWKRTGLLPAVFEGNVDKALKALKEHPLYSGLEGSGALNLVGRGAGAAAREISGDRVGGLERPDLPVRGTGVDVQRRYSKDLFRQGAQRLYDRTRHGREVRPDTLRGRHYLKEAANRFEAGQEAIRKEHIRQDMQDLKKIVPRNKLRRLDRKSAEVVNLAVERIARHPETFHEDLVAYKRRLEQVAAEHGPDGTPVLDKAQRAANKALVQQIDKALSLSGDRATGTVEAANAFVALQKPILDELVELKLLEPEQAAKASAIPFARIHMGAGHGVSKADLAEAERLRGTLQGLDISNATPEERATIAQIQRLKSNEQILDEHGEPLPLEAIQAEMERQGVAAPGFLSHRAPSAGDFYQSGVGGATLPKGVRTGQSVATGSQLGGVESVDRQIRRSRGLLDRAKFWNKAVTRFGIEVKGVKTASDAQLVLRDPARYGIDPGIQPVAVPRYPFFAKKNEIMGALEHQDPSIAGDIASGLLHDELTAAAKNKLPADAPIVFMPGKVVEELRSGAEPAGGGLRAAQAATSVFTRTVLPFSPGWYLGNGVDQAIRTALAGINPAHFVIGHKVLGELTPEERADLAAGAHFSSVSALNPHRSVDSLVRGYDPLSKGIRRASEWGQKHGWKQATVKFGPELLAKSSNYLIELNRFITEDLPQRGAIGKIALAEFRQTQHSWVKALVHQRQLAEDFAKGVRDPDKMIRMQKDLEEVYGNYTRMSPAARKVLRNISPFWTWFRAAYKFVFLTMPAHHSVSTAFLTAAARATKPTLEDYGLTREGKKPLPPYLQGAIPLPGGGIFPVANYSSFGYAGNPVEAVNKLAVPQYRAIFEALAGRDWKGNEIPGGEGGKILGAFWAFATAFFPGAPLLADEEEGRKLLKPHINLPHSYDAGYVQYKRQPTQTITVPESQGGSGSSSSASGIDYGSAFSTAGSGIDYGSAFGGP